MHEYSIVQALLEKVSTEAASRGASRVTCLWMRIGELSGVDHVLLSTAYETFRERTLCAGAPLMIERVPVSWRCPKCERPSDGGNALPCERCAAPVVLAQGDELYLDRIEMEVPDV